MPLHEPFREEELAPILEDFYQNGATIIRNVLSREECEQICRRVDQIFAEPLFHRNAECKNKARARWQSAHRRPSAI